jgi:hypothetical protein
LKYKYKLDINILNTSYTIIEDCILVKLLTEQNEKLTTSFINVFGKARSKIDGNSNRENLEKGSTIRIKHNYRNKTFKVVCEILDDAIINTIPKVTDLIQTTIGILLNVYCIFVRICR